MAPIGRSVKTGGMTMHLTGDSAADALLTENDLALLIGMLLDQHFGSGA